MWWAVGSAKLGRCCCVKRSPVTSSRWLPCTCGRGRWAYRGLLPDQYLDRLRPQDRAARYTFGASGSGGASTIVAVEQGAICGFASVGRSQDTHRAGGGELYAIYVHPNRWCHGLGRALITEARHHLTQRGFEEAILWVLVGNERAERLYRADGWSPDGACRRVELHAVTVDEIHYRGSLQ